jgi:hypothetical protein
MTSNPAGAIGCWCGHSLAICSSVRHGFSAFLLTSTFIERPAGSSKICNPASALALYLLKRQWGTGRRTGVKPYGVDCGWLACLQNYRFTDLDFVLTETGQAAAQHWPAKTFNVLC